MADKKLRLGIIGCGGISNIHKRSHVAHTDVDVVAACDIIVAKAEAWADDYAELSGKPRPKVFENYMDLITMGEIDAIDICTPNYLHSIIAVAALEHGIHVFSEKPDAINVVEAKKMQDAAEKSGKVLMVMRNNRYTKEAVYLKKYIEDGNMGEIYAARCGWIRRRGIPGKGGWFTTKAQSGGGPLIDLGVHMIDVTMWLMGNPKPVSVSACAYSKFGNNDVSESEDSSFGEKKKNGTFDVEDLAMGFIRFDNGACLQIEFSWASNIAGDDKFYELRGTKSGASIHKNVPLRLFTEEDGKLIDIDPPLPDLKEVAHSANLRHFADVILYGAEPKFTPDQGINMIKILEAIYTSAETGHEVLL